MHYGVTIAAVVHRKSLNAQSHFKKRTSLFLFLSLEKKVKKMICLLHIPEISAVFFFFFWCQLFRFHSSVPPSLSLAINIHPKIHAYILFFSFPLRPLGKKKTRSQDWVSPSLYRFAHKPCRLSPLPAPTPRCCCTRLACRPPPRTSPRP